MRDAFGEALCDLGRSNDRVIVLDADLGKSTRAWKFREMLPERFCEVGIAEQNMIGVAAGLATVGLLPFACTFACFMSKRATDQISISVAYPGLNVKLCGGYSGIFSGKTGATHHSLEDIAIFRAVPNVTVIEPADDREARQAVFAVAEHEGPCYLRIARDSVPLVTPDDYRFRIGAGLELRPGRDVTIVASGIMVHRALAAAERLSSSGVEAKVVNMVSIKPLDVDLLVRAACETGAVVTAENHNVYGGLGGAVAEVLAETRPVPVVRVGIDDRYAESGPNEAIERKYGLTPRDIVVAARRALELKASA